MRKWKYTTKIKQFIHEKDISIPDIGVNIATTLKRSLRKFENDWELMDIIDLFECSPTTSEDLDNALAELYNWADAHDCWVG